MNSQTIFKAHSVETNHRIDRTVAATSLAVPGRKTNDLVRLITGQSRSVQAALTLRVPLPGVIILPGTMCPKVGDPLGSINLQARWAIDNWTEIVYICTRPIPARIATRFTPCRGRATMQPSRETGCLTSYGGGPMCRKRILVLANSIKKGAHCVAGRELIGQDGDYVLGDWVRPISKHGQGELSGDEVTLNCGREVKMLDFIEMPLNCHAGDSCQPENWYIKGPRSWSDVSHRYAPYKIEWLEVNPRNLWLEPGNKTDRVSHARLCASPPHHSLYVVRPTEFRIRLFTDDRWDKKKQRAVFRYNGLTYNLPLTDPLVSGRYRWQIPPSGDRPKELRLPCGDDCLICVSLAGNFEDHHYKVVATVFEGVA